MSCANVASIGKGESVTFGPLAAIRVVVVGRLLGSFAQTISCLRGRGSKQSTIFGNRLCTGPETFRPGFRWQRCFGAWSSESLTIQRPGPETGESHSHRQDSCFWKLLDGARRPPTSPFSFSKSFVSP